MARATFGGELRRWRQARGLSQLQLAVLADVSQRHISFLENGRSRPSREMVIHLGLALEVPQREQNFLLVAAGHAAAFSETPLEELSEIAGVLEFILEAHEPNMAIVLDRRWDLVQANRAAIAFSAKLFPGPPDWRGPVPNLMRLSFHPEGLRLHMAHWERTASALLRRLERDVASHPNDPGLHSLLAEVRDYPDVSSLSHERLEPEPNDLLVPLTYLIDGDEVSLFTTIAVIGDAHDLTLAELRLETFWPMNRSSAETWNRLVKPV